MAYVLLSEQIHLDINQNQVLYFDSLKTTAENIRSRKTSAKQDIILS